MSPRTPVRDAGRAKKSTPKPADDALSARGPRRSRAPPSWIARRYGSAAGNRQPWYTWPDGPPENLVVRREENDLALRVDAELHAGRGRLARLQELLDDAAHRVELLEVANRASPRQPRRSETASASRIASRPVAVRDSGRWRCLPRRSCRSSFRQRAADARASARAARRAPRRRRPRERRSSDPSGSGDAGLPEDPAAARLRAEARERRIDAVQRNPEQDRRAGARAAWS